MNFLRLHEIGKDQENRGYKLFEDEQGVKYSAYCSNGDKVMMRTFASLNESGERDVPVFTKEYCEYNGIEREDYVTIDIENVHISLTFDEAKSIQSIIEGILNNRKFMKGSTLRESTIYNIDGNDIEAMDSFLSRLNQNLQQKELSPIMKQYQELKTKHPDALLLFRVGDFYETYKEDAITTSKTLGIIITNRRDGNGKQIDMAGFPFHSLDIYLPKLIRAGHRVAICDQL